jgi:hypothetical protein
MLESSTESVPSAERGSAMGTGASTLGAIQPTALRCSMVIAVLLLAPFAIAVEPDVRAEGSNESTRAAPLAIGEVGLFQGYEISVVSVTPNANQIVAQENQFNDPPGAGRQFFMARVSLTNTTSEVQHPNPLLVFGSVGDLAYTYLPFRESCGVYPDELIGVRKLASGASIEFNVCWNIDSRDQDSLVMYPDTMAHDAPPAVWFSLQDQATTAAGREVYRPFRTF